MLSMKYLLREHIASSRRHRQRRSIAGCSGRDKKVHHHLSISKYLRYPYYVKDSMNKHRGKLTIVHVTLRYMIAAAFFSKEDRR